MARGSDPLRPPSPAEDAFGMGEQGSCACRSPCPAPWSLDDAGCICNWCNAAALRKSHQRWLSSRESCKPDPPQGPAPSSLDSSALALPLQPRSSPPLAVPRKMLCHVQLHHGCHQAGCTLEAQPGAERSPHPALLCGVSKLQQLNYRWLQGTPPRWAPRLGDVPVGSCLEWERPGVFWRGWQQSALDRSPC